MTRWNNIPSLSRRTIAIMVILSIIGFLNIIGNALYLRTTTYNPIRGGTAVEYIYNACTFVWNTTEHSTHVDTCTRDGIVDHYRATPTSFLHSMHIHDPGPNQDTIIHACQDIGYNPAMPYRTHATMVADHMTQSCIDAAHIIAKEHTP